MPSSFDQNLLTCAKYILTADPAEYHTKYRPIQDFCTGIGNILQTLPTKTAAYAGQPTVTGPITTAVASSFLYHPRCMTAETIIKSCIEATPILTYGNNAPLTSCACYPSEIWQLSIFDDPILSYVSYLETADLSVYPYASGLVDFCANYGGRSNSPTSTTPTPGIVSLGKMTIVIYSPNTSSISQTTVSVKPSAGSSLQGRGFGKALLALTLVVLDVVLFF
jgi:hypothetical protein